MAKEIETKVVSMEEFCDMDFKSPSNFWIKNCLGEYCFFVTRDRIKAQQKCNEMFGTGFYTVNCLNPSKGKSNYSCTGTATRKK